MGGIAVPCIDTERGVSLPLLVVATVFAWISLSLTDWARVPNRSFCGHHESCIKQPEVVPSGKLTPAQRSLREGSGMGRWVLKHYDCVFNVDRIFKHHIHCAMPAGVTALLRNCVLSTRGQTQRATLLLKLKLMPLLLM